MIELENFRGENGLFPDDIAEILSTADPQKKKVLRRVGTMVVEHRRYEASWKWLWDHFQESGSGLEASAGLLHGPSGVGKSTLIRKFVKKFGGPFETSKGDVRPIIVVATPPEPNLGNIFGAMLRSLDAGHLNLGNTEDKKEAVITQLRLQDVKMIIMDEFTHVVEDKSEKFTKKAMRQFKEAMNANDAQLVFAGTEQLPILNNLYSQFRRRNTGDQIMTPFNWENDADRLEWTTLLTSISEGLLIPPRTPLNEQAQLLHMASDGVIDHLMKLLFRATSYAYDYGEDHIEKTVLAESFEMLRRGRFDIENPFGEPRVAYAAPSVTYEDEDEDGVTTLRSSGKGPKETFTK